jgi:hypothetical protein
MKMIVDLNLVTLASTQVEIEIFCYHSYHFFSFNVKEYMVCQLTTISIAIA